VLERGSKLGMTKDRRAFVRNLKKSLTTNQYSYFHCPWDIEVSLMVVNVISAPPSSFYYPLKETITFPVL
jgi:hypothetical protein